MSFKHTVLAIVVVLVLYYILKWAGETVIYIAGGLIVAALLYALLHPLWRGADED